MNDLLSALKTTLFEGYATSTLTAASVFLCIGLSACVGAYVYFVYRLIRKNAFYNRSFHLSLIALTVITAAIILTIQSNVIVSLGMVGALSIVRFRTAVKDPMDLVFLFWAISVGIICGAGFAMIAVIASLVLTVILLVAGVLPAERGTLMLVVNASENVEDAVMAAVRPVCPYARVRARSVSHGAMNLAVELRTKDPASLISSLTALEHVTSVSLLEHDGDVTA